MERDETVQKWQTIKEKEKRDLTREVEIIANRYISLLDELKHTTESTFAEMEAKLIEIRFCAGRLYEKTMTLEACESAKNQRLYQPLEGCYSVPSDYHIEGNRADGFRITMPLLPRKAESMNTNQTKLMAEFTAELVEKHLRKKHIRMPVYSFCEVHFEELVGSDYPRRNVIDPDNLDTKQVLDSLAMLLYKNDDALHLKYSVSARETDGKSCTVITVRNLRFPMPERTFTEDPEKCPILMENLAN